MTKIKEKLTKYQKRVRSEIYLDTWNKYKEDITMLCLAQIFKTSLSNFYQIIKRKESK